MNANRGSGKRRIPLNAFEGVVEALRETEIAALPGKARAALLRRVQEALKSLEDLREDLDRVERPRAVFDPGNPQLVGLFTALALVVQQRLLLAQATAKQFYGSGIYALYYKGGFPAYRVIAGSETPVYVGKADPVNQHARTPKEQGIRLWRRLSDHVRNIKKVQSLGIDDFDCRYLIVQTGWQEAGEAHLIDIFKPIWNDEIRIAYGFGKHGDDPATRRNLRSPWDTLHPGREWAYRDPKMQDARSLNAIQQDIQSHFAANPPLKHEDDILHLLVNRLREIQA